MEENTQIRDTKTSNSRKGPSVPTDEEAGEALGSIRILWWQEKSLELGGIEPDSTLFQPVS